MNNETGATAMGLDEIRDDLSRSGLWCGEAVLEAFGVTVRGKTQTCQAAVCNALSRAGYTLTDEHAPWDKPVTLSRFIAEHPEGDYYIYTADHNMALRDGILTDTDLDGTGLRRVRYAVRID